MRTQRGGPGGPRKEGSGGWGSPGGPPMGPGRGRGRGRFQPDHEGGPPFGHHRRTRRGEIRTGLLAILTEGPGHGYELIQRIEAKTAGAWKPSPGSVYPTLQLLEDEGLVTVIERDGKRVFELTEAGVAESARRSEEQGGEEPWSRGAGGRPPAFQLFEAMKQTALAAKQVAMAGNPAQVEAAIEIVKDARKKLYQLLAADE